VNNCLGRGNYKYFLALLASTGVLLAYGAFLCYITLAPQVKEHFKKYPEWHISEYAENTDFLGRVLYWFDRWIDILGTSVELGGICRGGVGFLALFTSPLPTGLLAYHIYLIWAGMTTNESAKWSDWQEDIQEKLVWVTDMDQRTTAYRQQETVWPRRSDKFLVFTNDGREPRNVASNIAQVVLDGSKARWRKPDNLKEVDNIYDLGFIGNLKEAFGN
jgi:hypothetical protein